MEIEIKSGEIKRWILCSVQDSTLKQSVCQRL